MDPANAHPYLMPTALPDPPPPPDASDNEVQMQLAEAVRVGDYDRIDLLGTRLLQTPAKRMFGTDHVRLFLIVAAARTRGTIAGPADLPDYWQTVGPTLTLLHLEVENARGAGKLLASFTKAAEFVDTAHRDAAARGQARDQSAQIGYLSAVRDLPNASRLAWHGVDLNADAPALYGEAKLNAEYRHHHSKQIAYVRGRKAMVINPRWPATLNTFAATCRELGKQQEAMSAVARSMAVKPDRYAVNTMHKIGCVFAQSDMTSLAERISGMLNTGRSHTARQKVAIEALAASGFRAEVEAVLDLPSRSVTTTDVLAMRDRADSFALAGGAA